MAKRYRGIAGTRDDDFIVVLQTEDRARVAVEGPEAAERSPVPHLDGVVAESGDDFLVVVLQTINALRTKKTSKSGLKLGD